MHKYIFTGIVAFAFLFCSTAAIGQSGTSSIKLSAYKRITLNGVAPSVEIKVGDEEKAPAGTSAPTDYFIYLITNRVPNLQLNQVWIQQELYTASLSRVTSKPVVLENGKYSDTLVQYTKKTVWQITLTGKDMTGIQPKKVIANQVASNELVLRLSDSKGAIYTRTVKNITTLKPFAGM